MRRNEINLPEAPQHDRPNDLWMCGRTDAEGCSRGPCHKGRCHLDPPCKPRQTWAGKRRPYAAMAVLLVVVFGAALSLTPWTSHYFKPGGLTGKHAQILSGTMSSDRCASCHADATKESWFSLGGSSHVGVTLSDRCLNCHHETFDVESAKWAHNISPEQRTELRLASSRNDGFSIHNFLPGPSFDQNNVECSTCHKEHRGSDANLLSLSDAQCQTCHSSRFAGFSSGHPDWAGWPYDQYKMITFDHRTHSTKHFPASNIDGHPASFDCNACHQRTDDGELTRTVAFESGCASCHDDSLRLQIKSGIALASLPSVGDQTAEGLPSWPEDATGFFDGAVSPLTMLLLARDADAVQALQMIPQGDFSRVDEDDPNQVAAAKVIAEKLIGILHKIASEGQPGLRASFADAGYDTEPAEPIIRSLPPSLVADAFNAWFVAPNAAANTASADPPTSGPFKLAAFPETDDVEFNQQLEQLRSMVQVVEQPASNPPQEPKPSANPQPPQQLKLPAESIETRQPKAATAQTQPAKAPTPPRRSPETSTQLSQPTDTRSGSGFDAEFVQELIELKKLDRESTGKTQTSSPATKQDVQTPKAPRQNTVAPPATPVQQPAAQQPEQPKPVPATEATTPQPSQTDPPSGQPSAFPFDPEFNRELEQLRDLGMTDRPIAENKLRPRVTPPSQPPATKVNPQPTAVTEQSERSEPLTPAPLMTPPPPNESTPSKSGVFTLPSHPIISNDVAAEEQAPPTIKTPDLSTVQPKSAIQKTEAIALANPVNFDARTMQPDGGWYRDDLRMSINYRPTGHADPVLRSTLELAAQLNADNPVRHQLLSASNLKACVSCHAPADDHTIAWKSTPHIGDRSSFTKFSHAPHLNIQTMADCTHCHQISLPVSPAGKAAGSADVNIASVINALSARPAESDPHAGLSDTVGIESLVLTPEFMKLGHAACTSCHTSGAAGDNCTQCHRYHIHQNR